jgi:hypothetical protein
MDAPICSMGNVVYCSASSLTRILPGCCLCGARWQISVRPGNWTGRRREAREMPGREPIAVGHL